MLLKACIVFLVIACAETLHGIWRVRFLNRRVGDRRARQLGLISGSLIIFALSCLLIPWIAPPSVNACLVVGFAWVLLMTVFEFSVGRLVFRMKWKRIRRDFNLREGGYMGIAMLFLFLCPLLAAYFRRILIP